MINYKTVQFCIIFIFITVILIAISSPKKSVCPEYYSILYKQNGDILCVAPTKPKTSNPSIYDPKLREKH
jgi:hypothetical protein